MKKALPFILAMFLSLPLFGQGVCYSSFGIDQTGRPIANPKVRVCSEPASGTTCTPLVAGLFSDQALTTPISNPTTGDQYGNFSFCVAPARVHVQVTNSAGTSQTDISNIDLRDPTMPVTLTYTSVAFSATPTFNAGTNSIFAMTLTGNVTSSTVTNPTTGQVIVVQFCQDAVGGRTVVWPASFTYKPTIRGAANACTSNSFYYDGAAWRQLARMGDSSGATILDQYLLIGYGTPKQVSGGPELIGLNNATASQVGFAEFVGAEANARFLLDMQGNHEWGMGGANDQSVILGISAQGRMNLTLNASGGASTTGLNFVACASNHPCVTETQPRVSISLDGSIGLGAGGATAIDVTLIRGAANIFNVQTAAAGGMGVLQTGDTNQRIFLDDSGAGIKFSSGALACDVNLSRFGVGILSVDASPCAAGGTGGQLRAGSFQFYTSLASLTGIAAPSTTGTIRLGTTDTISFRNAGNTGDVTAIDLNASNQLVLSTLAAVTSAVSVTSPFFSTATANPASTGVLRVANTEGIYFRNAANNADYQFTLDASNRFVLGNNGFTLTSTAGGGITVSVSTGASNGGTINFSAGTGASGFSGGNISGNAGSGAGAADGGQVAFQAGNSGLGATGNGGLAELIAGGANSTNGNGGDIILQPGAKAGSGFGGRTQLNRIYVSGPAPACAFTTGGGTSPSCTVQAGSTDTAGTIIATTGTGSPGSTGTITLTFSVNGFNTANAPVCMYNLSNAGAAWNGRATTRDNTPAVTSDVFAWDNNAVALTASTAYQIGYLCVAK